MAVRHKYVHARTSKIQGVIIKETDDYVGYAIFFSRFD